MGFLGVLMKFRRAKMRGFFPFGFAQRQNDDFKVTIGYS